MRSFNSGCSGAWTSSLSLNAGVRKSVKKMVLILQYLVCLLDVFCLVRYGVESVRL